MKHLPVDDILPELEATLGSGGNAVLLAPPGAGKTTRVPPFLAMSGLLEKDNPAVVMLQPRRIAARASATRIANERQWILGREVGYQIRFEKKWTPQSKVRVYTEGILTRLIQQDPFLEGIGAVILDEFHERNVYTDLSLALLREIQEVARPDLKILVMSATMDPGPVSNYLGNCSIIRSEGRMFPVTHDYLRKESTAPIWEQTAEAVHRTLVEQNAGHVLVFLPGMGEIRRTEKLIRTPPGCTLHVLHSSVSSEEQDLALTPCDHRKIILSTNIAETSLTIDGVRVVIDAGWEKVLINDHRLGIDRLESRRISMASADQRAGRAGRTAPGHCYRLWTQAQELAFPATQVAEIHRIDISSTILLLKGYGVEDLSSFNWFEKPDSRTIEQGLRLLRSLGALDEKDRITDLGRRLGDLPLHPRLGRVFIASEAAGHASEGAFLVSCLNDLPFFLLKDRPRGQSGESDLENLLEQIRRTHRSQPWKARIDNGKDQLLRYGAKPSSTGGPYSSAKCLMLGFPDRVCQRRGKTMRAIMANGRGIQLDEVSCVREAEYFLALDPRDGRGNESMVSLAVALDRDWIFEELAGQIEKRRVYTLGDQKLLAQETECLGVLELRTRVAAPTECPEAREALREAMRAVVTTFMEEDKDLAQWSARCRFLAKHCPELALPTDGMEYLLGVAADLVKKWNWKSLTSHSVLQSANGNLPWPVQEALRQEAPERLTTATGKSFRIDYTGDGAPVFAVKLQEVFGWREAPKLAKGRARVVLHLLGPNYRPVQVTEDLQSFWNTTYHEVRKELRGRYPKHRWPEDPWNI